MPVSFSDKTLGAGSIGGQGFWLVRDSYYYSMLGADEGMAWQGMYNSNAVMERPLEEALIYNEKLPCVLNQSPLDFLHGSFQTPSYRALSYGNATGLPWKNLGSFGGYPLYGAALAGQDNLDMQRHAHRVLSMNVVGAFLISAERIQLGNEGYTDPLPGLFQIEPIASTIVSDDHCYVTIKQYSNPRVWWQPGSTKVYYNFYMDFGTANHPYLRDSSNPVRVDLSPDNDNRHVIPGVSLKFNNPMSGDKTCVSIGYEYCNAWNETGDFGEIGGMKDYFVPLTSRGCQPWRKLVGYNEEYGLRPGYLSGLPRWHVYNVSGHALSGCKFSVRPLVRLDQGNALIPFTQWFMGYDVTTAIPQSTTPYTISFSNYEAGTPPRITIQFSNGSISKLIREIDSVTFQPTGVVHSDGSGLKCDGATLYRWDSVGVYFVLAPMLNIAYTALVWVRPGAGWENGFNIDTSQPFNWKFVTAPFSQTIGGWDGIYDSGNDKYYPVSHGASSSYRTGVIQTQGYDFEFFDADIDPTTQHWYNHSFIVPTYGVYTEELGLSNLNEYVVMVTSDDEKYFQVAPCSLNIVDDKALARSNFHDPQYTVQGSLQVGVPDQGGEITGSANVQERDGQLILRINQVSEMLSDFWASEGITIE